MLNKIQKAWNGNKVLFSGWNRQKILVVVPWLEVQRCCGCAHYWGSLRPRSIKVVWFACHVEKQRFGFVYERGWPASGGTQTEFRTLDSPACLLFSGQLHVHTVHTIQKRWNWCKIGVYCTLAEWKWVTCKRRGTNEKDRDFGQFFRHLNVRSVDTCAPTSSHWPRELQIAEVAERLCAVVEWSNDALSHMLIFGHFWYSKHNQNKFCLWTKSQGDLHEGAAAQRRFVSAEIYSEIDISE
jgi:hypothetical protein